MATPSVAAIVACVDPEGRVLLVKQVTGPFAGAWLLPGGMVERDETPENGARRELLEETGLTAGHLHAVAEYEVRSNPRGKFHVVLAMYRGAVIGGTPRPEDGSAIRWVNPREFEAHPSLAVELVDLDLMARDRATLVRDLARIGVEMKRID